MRGAGPFAVFTLGLATAAFTAGAAAPTPAVAAAAAGS